MSTKLYSKECLKGSHFFILLNIVFPLVCYLFLVFVLGGPGKRNWLGFETGLVFQISCDLYKFSVFFYFISDQRKKNVLFFLFFLVMYASM